MPNFLVSGLINIETSLHIPGFPLEYNPVNYPFYGVRTTVSGVGYNVARALAVLGNTVSLLSLVGRDPQGKLVEEGLADGTLDSRGVLHLLDQTPQSVILHADDGFRQIWVDLKDIQEQVYPEEHFSRALAAADWLVLCNINYSRPMLALAQQAGKPVTTDVHAISSIEDGYNRDFMEAAQVLFLSDENLPEPPDRFSQRLMERYPAKVIVTGLGAKGALLHVRGEEARWFPVLNVRPVVNTIGAGDALFSAFLDGYAKGQSPTRALHRAMVFAGYKVGSNGGAEGFLDRAGLDELENQI